MPREVIPFAYGNVLISSVSIKERIVRKYSLKIKSSTHKGLKCKLLKDIKGKNSSPELVALYPEVGPINNFLFC